MPCSRRRGAALWCAALALALIAAVGAELKVGAHTRGAFGGLPAPLSRQPPDDITVEAARLAEVLQIKPGMTVAEIGAGGGEFTVAIAKRVGEAGRMYSTELDKYRLRDIKNAVDAAGLQNVKVVEGDESRTNVPPDCCDAIFMRRVYHHFTHPAAMDASIMASLRPGGRLAVIDFPPRGGDPPPGVPADRGGHGVSAEIVVRELIGAGFEHARTIRDWPGDMYLALFRKK